MQKNRAILFCLLTTKAVSRVICISALILQACPSGEEYKNQKVLLLPDSGDLFCLHTSKPKETWTGVYSKENRGLFKEKVPSLKTLVS